MSHDLVIRGGTVIDGSGNPRFSADVAIDDGRIAAIGKVSGRGREEIDARDQVVAPGFVDGHTHMDAQIAWDPLGTCSCYHGVTSVVMGNCGFTLAPVKPDQVDLVLYNLERAEDISMAAMKAGIEVTWESFAKFLDVLDALPKGINYAGYVGHSALRTWAMGERAFEGPATSDDLARMKGELERALAAGAMGLSTSRSGNHMLPDGRPVASRMADWREVEALVGVMGERKAGIFEIANEEHGQDTLRSYHERLRDLAISTGRPVTFGVFNRRAKPDEWRAWMNLVDETNAAGGHMFAQVHSRALAVLFSFETRMPFDKHPEWRVLRGMSRAEKAAHLRDPERRAALIAAVDSLERLPDFEWLFVMDDPLPPYRSVAELARERSQHPAEVIIDEALAMDLERMFVYPIANENQADALEAMRHPRSVVTFSDSGAHVSQIMDSSLQTHVLSHWVREEGALTLEEAVRMLSFETASAWNIPERGLLREGYAADVIVFDPDRIAPDYPRVVTDLPAGAKRLVQKADGLSATIVAGQVVLMDGEATGNLPGRVLRAAW